MEVDRIHSFSRCELLVMDEVKSGGPGVYRGLRSTVQTFCFGKKYHLLSSASINFQVIQLVSHDGTKLHIIQ